MDIDLLWLLLLPVLFGLGWLAARIDLRQLLRDARSVPQDYFRGLNLLLHDEPEAALKLIEGVAHNHRDAVELQLALASLYRKKGELDKAIRLHQTILDRGDLVALVRNQTLLELGLDYRKAGLFDRAEETYTRLLSTSEGTAAREALLEIYQQEREWQSAIDMAEQLDDAAHSRQHQVAQFHCELAHRAISASQLDVALQHVKTARSVHRKCIRATLLEGDILRQQGALQGAIDLWLGIEHQDSNALALAAPRILAAYDAQGQVEAGMTRLLGLYESVPSLDLLLPVFQRLLEMGQTQQAYALIRAEVRRFPSLAGLNHLLSLQIEATPPERRPDLELVRNLVHQHAERDAQYHCSACGFRAKQYFWHCPGCSNWETYPPLKKSRA